MAYGARLESVLSESSQGFESPILRHCGRFLPAWRQRRANSSGMLTSTPGTLETMTFLVSQPSRARVRAAAAYPNRLLLAQRHGGTNGWTSSWGTNAHGEIAGCPPPLGS